MCVAKDDTVRVVSSLSLCKTTETPAAFAPVSRVAAVETKNTQQDTAITNLQNSVSSLQTTVASHTNAISSIQTKDAQQDSAISAIQAKDAQQDTAITNLQNSGGSGITASTYVSGGINLSPINSLGGVWVTDQIPLPMGTSLMTGKIQISAYASFEGSSLLGGIECIAFVTDQNSGIVGFIDQSFAEARPSALNN